MHRSLSLRGLALAFAFALLLTCRGIAVASPADDVAAVFQRFVDAQNAKNHAAVSDLLLDSNDFLWITNGNPIWTRDAALKQFDDNWTRVWELKPLAAPRVMMLSKDVAQLYVPIDYTIGKTASDAQVIHFLINQTLVKTPSGWVIASILPIRLPPPAPAPQPSPSR